MTPRTKNLLLLAGATLWLATRPADVLTELKLTTEAVHDQTFYQLTTEAASVDLPYEARQAGKRLSVSARTSAVRAMGAVVRTYVQSAVFRSRYDRWLQEQYQVSDQQTADARQTEQTSMADVRALADQQVTQTNATFAQMPPATLAMMLQQQMIQLQQQVADADAPAKAALTRDLMVLRQLQPLATTKPAEFKTQYMAFLNRYMARQMRHGLDNEETRLADSKAKAAEYRSRLAQYQANANPNQLLKKRLAAFVALAESVDFDAKVSRQGDKLEFVRADYRQQSDDWKLLYRIGREPVMAARDMARAWLKELS
ncbi:hypothetical protein GGR92_001898 [Spirosoma lacussanchae]|uniref:hypothetical protein n=1 Tax=Spirosoma lacussanchae TaxID=1884249 RepID=UPI00110895AA|nr:hypothetical protein [Spirosoma lacussanchae]